jgi:hypothetical protein
MRSIFAGIIILSASMAVVHPAQAEKQPQRPPGYSYVQTPFGHQQSNQDDLRSTQDDLQKIEKDNEEPASHDDIIGVGQVRSGEDALTKRIGQEGVRLDREIRNICTSCRAEAQQRDTHNGSVSFSQRTAGASMAAQPGPGGTPMSSKVVCAWRVGRGAGNPGRAGVVSQTAGGIAHKKSDLDS